MCENSFHQPEDSFADTFALSQTGALKIIFHPPYHYFADSVAIFSNQMCQHIFTSLNAIWLLVKMLCNQACTGFPAALRVKCISAVALRSYAVMRTGVDGRAVLPMGLCGMLD